MPPFHHHRGHIVLVPDSRQHEQLIELALRRQQIVSQIQAEAEVVTIQFVCRRLYKLRPEILADPRAGFRKGFHDRGFKFFVHALLHKPVLRVFYYLFYRLSITCLTLYLSHAKIVRLYVEVHVNGKSAQVA